VTDGALQLIMMGPKSRPGTRELLHVAREDEADLRAALEEAREKTGRVLTAEQLKQWAETGEWPDDQQR
jgi:hypothetical protein